MNGWQPRGWGVVAKRVPVSHSHVFSLDPDMGQKDLLQFDYLTERHIAGFFSSMADLTKHLRD